MAPSNAMRLYFSESTQLLIVSAPARVLPNPRPARINHVRQLPFGGSCSGRAILLQSVCFQVDE